MYIGVWVCEKRLSPVFCLDQLKGYRVVVVTEVSLILRDGLKFERDKEGWEKFTFSNRY